MARGFMIVLLAGTAVVYAWAGTQVNKLGESGGDLAASFVPLFAFFGLGAAVSCVLLVVHKRWGLVAAVLGGALTAACMTAVGAYARLGAGFTYFSGDDLSDVRADAAADGPIILVLVLLSLLTAVLAGWLRHRDAPPSNRPGVTLGQSAPDGLAELAASAPAGRDRPLGPEPERGPRAS